MTTNVYIDGFNLYYGALKYRWPQYKWLDLESFCESLLPDRTVNRIRYFSARFRRAQVSAGTRRRHQTYLRALRTLPRVDIHLGTFLSHPVRMPLVNPPASGSSSVLVQKTEEKGTDVNLVSHLLLDCFRQDFDEAVVISNDSDMATAVEMVMKEYGKSVGVINPGTRKNASSYLQGVASWSYATINRRHFANNQFGHTLTDCKGTFSKPPSW